MNVDRDRVPSHVPCGIVGFDNELVDLAGIGPRVNAKLVGVRTLVHDKAEHLTAD